MRFVSTVNGVLTPPAMLVGVVNSQLQKGPQTADLSACSLFWVPVRGHAETAQPCDPGLSRENPFSVEHAMKLNKKSRARLSGCYVGLPALFTVAAATLAVAFGGCGLGFIETTAESAVSLRIENAAPDTANVNVTTSIARVVTDHETHVSTTEIETVDTNIRVQAGEVTGGAVLCGDMLTVTVTVGDAESAAVDLTGAGTGTPGFDSGSVGLTGERFLIADTHFACNDTILIQLPRSDSGEIDVVAQGAPLPEPITSGGGTTEPDPGDGDGDVVEPEVEQVALVVVNETESTVQVNFAAGDGTLSGGDGSGLAAEFDVRVPSGATTRGSAECATEYIVAAAHLEATATTYSEGGATIFDSGGGVNFHGVVLTGDGTGTDGFDSTSIPVSRGRLLQDGIHYACGETVTVTITATNNQVEFDDEGGVVLDEFGNPTLRYNVGSGFIFVTPGG